VNHMAFSLGQPQPVVSSLGFYIAGELRQADGRDVLVRESPAISAPVTHVTLCTRDDLNAAVVAARKAFKSGAWSRISGAERGRVLNKIAALIRRDLEQLAVWEVLESGKPISQARAEIEGAAGHYEYCAGIAQSMHGEAYNNLGDAMLGLVIREPAGVVGLITPWNFPFIVLAERLPYILASGNSVVVKPSELTSTTTVMLAGLAKEAGLPDGVFNVVTGTGPIVGQGLSEHLDVDMISFTGSTRVGEAVLKASATNFKKVGLELGGKNPQIIFQDADLDAAADGVVFGMCFNAGQCCVSGSRLLVDAQIEAQFVAKVIEKLGRMKRGDCFDPATQIGAICTSDHLGKILGYVDVGKREGANLLHGGKQESSQRGTFFAPTVFGGVKPDMRIAQEEIFGPVLSVLTFKTFDEAMALANVTDYGLAASIWSKNMDTAIAAARQVQAGRTWVNTTIAGGPGQPMGGYKRSGIGREGGKLGVEEYTEVKTVHIALGARANWVA